MVTKLIFVVMMLVTAPRVYAASCGGSCIPGLTPTTGARGIKVPQDCACDWEDAVNENWNLFNSAYQAPDLVCTGCVAATDIASNALTPDKLQTSGQGEGLYLKIASGGLAWGAGGTGGGDSVKVDGAATVDPNFSDAGDINFEWDSPDILATVKPDSVALGTDTTGSYVSSVTANQGLATTGTEGASVGFADCAANEVMKRNVGDTAWECVRDFPTFNVTSYGAVGSDGTDDTAAFTAMSAALPATSGAKVIIPCGTYLLASTSPTTAAAWSINKPNITIEGENESCAVLKFSDAATTDIRLIGLADSAGSNISGLTIRNLTLDGNGSVWASGGHNGITRANQAVPADNITIEHVTFKNFYNASISNTSVIQFTAQGWTNLRLQHLTLLSNRALGLNIACTAGTCADLVISDIYVNNGTATAQAQQNILVGNTITGRVHVDHVTCETPCAGTCVMIQASNSTLSNSIANGCPSDQFIISPGVATAHALSNVTVTGNLAINGGDGGFGFEATAAQDGCENCTFTGNVARKNYSSGLFILNTKNLNVSGNVFSEGCQNPSPPVGCGGIMVTGVASHGTDNTLLANNVFSDNQVSPTQRYAIYISNVQVTNTTIDGSNFQGSTVSDIHLIAALNTRIRNYSGQVITVSSSPTYSISGGAATYAQLAALDALAAKPANGSYLGCSDCNSTCTAGSSTGQLCHHKNAVWASQLLPQKLGGIGFDMGPGNTIATSDEWVFELAPYASTITSIRCEAYGGTSFTIKVCAGEDAGDDTCATNLLDSTESTTLVCGTSGASDSTINVPGVAASGKVTVVVTAVSGTVQKGEVSIVGTPQ